MTKIRGFLAAVAFMALPVTVCAEPPVHYDSLADSNLTWNVVNLSRLRNVLPQQKPNHWFTSYESSITARMGIYLGQAETLPRSVVGWDYRQDLASRVRYGIYLVNHF